jgi:hypothetical protein
LGIVTVGLLTATSTAATITYDANAEMYASENGATPSPTFGTWSLGYRDVIASSDFTTFTAAVGDANAKGWAFDSTWLPDVVVNYNAYTVDVAPLYTNLGEFPSTCLHLHPGFSSDDPDHPGSHQYTVLRWTAPEAGAVNLSANLFALGTGTTDQNILHNGAVVASNSFAASEDPRSWNGSQSNLSVGVGDTLEIVIGRGGGPINGNAIGAWCSVTYVPEPSAIVLAVIGLMGLLAYAWRTQR